MKTTEEDMNLLTLIHVMGKERKYNRLDSRLYNLIKMNDDKKVSDCLCVLNNDFFQGNKKYYKDFVLVKTLKRVWRK